jgi:hypothetical protein
VRSDIGYSFVDALRSILRHNKGIVLVGEVRDSETAKIMGASGFLVDEKWQFFEACWGACKIENCTGKF